MPSPSAPRKRKLSPLFPLGLLAATAAALGNTPVEPTSRPADPNDPAELLRHANENLAATRPASPASRPTTSPAEVSADARKQLDAVRDAYGAIKSLRLAGTIAFDIDVDGKVHSERGKFDSTFVARPGAIGKFRHVARDAAEGSAAGPDNTLVISTGERVVVYQPAARAYSSVAAPATRPTGRLLGEDVNSLLVGQNPSLLLAVVDDAAAEVLDGVTKVEKGDDLRIGDQSYPSLALTAPKGTRMTMAFDPATHLLRQMTTDQTESVRAGGQPDVRKVQYTVDYTTAEVGAAVADEQFAWAAPEGAKDQTDRAPSKLELSPAENKMAEAFRAGLEGKPAPDFTFKGMDGKEVRLSEQKGSVVLIDFWATWCVPCVKSLPALNKMYDAKKPAGLKAFAVNEKEEKADVEAFIAETKLTIPVLLDTEGKARELFKHPGIPATIVVGKDGVVKRAVMGAQPENHVALEKAIDEALK